MEHSHINFFRRQISITALRERNSDNYGAFELILILDRAAYLANASLFTTYGILVGSPP